LKDLENSFLGKEGSLKAILAGIKDLSPEEEKTFGVEANELRIYVTGELIKKQGEIKVYAYQKKEKEEAIDVTLEYPLDTLGHMHPISIASDLLEEIFISLGFKIEDGPQIETEEYNFDKLNIPDNHPARDVWDTFWVHDDINKDRPSGDKYLLRTHTSPVQIRTMLK
jgi:phenylalanyl-tRNA synthetase alpha chain